MILFYILNTSETFKPFENGSRSAYGMKLNVKKCDIYIYQIQVEYLGHIIGPNRIL